MDRDTSAMVIPSFYIRDDEAGPPGKRSARDHASGKSSSNARESSFQPPSPIPASLEAPERPSGEPADAPGEHTSAWGESEIITNLFLGDLQDAGRFDGMIISVLPDAMAAEPKRTIRLPFLANGRATLDSTSALIDAGLRLGMPVLVHCEEGCERAPLVIAWFLKTRRAMTLDEAYGLIKSRRPIVKDRRSWLGIYNQ